MKSTLRRASWVAKIFSPVIWVMALWVVLGGGGQPAYATHFRYGHIYWTSLSGNTVQFTVQNAFRRSFLPSVAYECLDPATLTTIPCSAADGLPGPGDVFQEDIGLTQLLPGDNSQIDSPLGTLLYVVTSIDPTNEWLFALALDPASLPAIDTTITHTYPTAGTYTVAAIDSCCRISPVPSTPPFGINAHINNPDGGYRLETVVNVGSGNSSPVSALPPIILCPINALCSFQVPGVDPDGDPLHFRLSTASEASSSAPDSACAPSTFCQPGPPFAPNAASISSTGLYTWNTTGASLGLAGFNTLYSTQVTIEDLDAAGNVKSKVAVDFFIQLVPVEVCGDGIDNNGDGVIDQNCTPPRFDPPPQSGLACGSTTPITLGSSQSFTVQASDADPGQTVSLNVAGLPASAILTPALPTSGNPVSSTFAWTPTAADVGTYVITFTATDNSGAQAGPGLQTLCPITLVVLPGGGSCQGYACPTTFLNLGAAANYAVFALNTGSKQTANFSNVTVNGNVAIAAGATLKLMAPSTINGNLDVDSGGSWSNGPGKVNGTVSTNKDLSGARTAALNASAQAAALSPNFTFTSVTSNRTVTGVSGLNVIKITGNINLNNKSLTLTGPADAIFVINLSGSLTLGGSGGIMTSGGVSPSQVLVNMTGTGSLISTHVGNIINAVVLGPNVGGTIHSANGSFLLGRDFTLMSGAKVNFQPCICP